MSAALAAKPLLLLILMLLLGPLSLQARMPGWKFFKDREGNTYYIDQAGKIRITDVRPRYMPVSAKSIDYCLQSGITLINDRRAAEGLSVLKSILSLPVDNNRVFNAQVKASEMMQVLKKRHGTRYAALDESASLLFVRYDSFIEIIHDHMFYSFRVPAPLEVLRVRNRQQEGVDYRYSGLLIGIWESDINSKPGADTGYDILFAVDSERYSVRVKDLSQAIAKWRNNIGYDDLKREILFDSENKLVYRFTSSGKPGYAGIEGIIVNGNISHCIRLLSSEKKYQAASGTMLKIVNSFKTVSKTR